MTNVMITEPGYAALATLLSAIDERQLADPLAPVTVAVPSPYAGLTVRHELAARSGFVNVHFVSLNRIAELLGAPFLSAGRRPLTAALTTEATRLALVETGVLDDSPRTVGAVTATLREAMRAGVTPTGDLARVQRRRRALLRDYYDHEDQLHAAARVVAGDAPTLEDLGTVIWYLPQRVTPGTAALARALAEAGRLAVVVAETGDRAADGAATDLSELLGTPCHAGARRKRRVPTATGIVVAPDHDTEVRSIAARVLAHAREGTEFHRMAVTFTRSDPYLRLVHERFRAAGIPMAGPASRRLADTSAGRVLAGLLGTIEEGLPRDGVIDLLAAAPLRPDLADASTVARWDTISRSAGVVAGADEWDTRLVAWRLRHEGDTSEVDALGEVVRLLVPHGEDWPGRTAHAARVLRALLGSGRHLPVDEREAYDELLGALRSLSALGELGGDADAFAGAVLAALDSPFGRVGTVGTGVLVAPMPSLGGAVFDAVFVLGLDEAATTGAALEDPLLPGHGLALERRARHRGAYLAALATAPRRIVSFPRADLRAERATTPSPWVVEAATILAGRPMAAAELLAADGAGPWLEAVPSLESLVAEAPPGPDEARLAALLGWQASGGAPQDVPIEDDVLVAGLEATTARAGGRAGGWDGVVGPLPGLAPDDEHPSSATRLETWATCPFRYFLRSVLRVDDLERPETLTRIDPRVRGSLVHEALREFLAAHNGKPPDEAWTGVERAELISVVERLADDAAREGLVGHPSLWAIDRRRILAQARSFLDVDERLRAAHGTSPWLQEVGFGTDADDDLDALDLDLGGTHVRFRGRVDRVDRSADGRRVEVFDYKTGRPRRAQLAEDPVAGGALLQPVLYGMLLQREMPDAEIGSHYWYTQASDDAVLDGLDHLDDGVAPRLVEALGIVTDAIVKGVFPRDPGEDGYRGPEHCRRCDFDRACPADRVRTAETRGVDDPAFGPLRRLRRDPGGSDVTDAATAGGEMARAGRR